MKPLIRTTPRVTEPRLLVVLAMIARGFTNARIGHELGITEDTVKRRCRVLFEDLGATDRAHAVAIGYQQRYLGTPCRCRGQQ